MKLLIHLTNILCWTLVMPVFALVLSWIFPFTYIQAVSSVVFIIIEVIFSVVMMFTYLSGVFDSDEENPLEFIPVEKKHKPIKF